MVLTIATLALLAPMSKNSVQLILDDMTLPHEPRPAGVPVSYDWGLKPRVGMGNDSKGFRAFIPWGQLYEAEGGNPAKNTKVELRTLKGYWLSKKTGKWSLLSTSDREGIEGNAYVADFKDDVNKPSGARVVGKGVVVGAGGGYNYHFWPKNGRVSIDPDDIAGIFTTCEARLVRDDPAKPDDRDRARLVLSIGGDYWKALDSQWDQLKTNGDAGIGRFRLVRKEWGWFNMCTLPAERLKANPPPGVTRG